MIKNLLQKRNTLLFSFLVLLASGAFAQAPKLINYQAIARDGGQLVASGTVNVKFRIYENGCTNLKYEEEHINVNTNAYGLFNVKIGGGTLVSGNWSAIQWNSSINAYYLQMDIAVNGGNYQTLPCEQFVSVPYALNGPAGATGPTGQAGANGAAGATGPTGNPGPNTIFGTAPYLLKAWGTGKANNSVIIQDTIKNFIGIGNPAPKALLHVGTAGSPDDVVFEGVGNIFGTNTKLYGKGTAKFVFNPEVAAFRLGVNTTANLWDGPLMGPASMAIGVDVQASGQGSVAFGASSKALAFGTLTIGSYLQADSMNSMVFGFGSSNGPVYLRNYRKQSIAIGASSSWPSIYIAAPIIPQYGRASNVCVGAMNIRKSINDLPRSTFEVAGSMALAVSTAGGSQADLTGGADTISVLLVSVAGSYNVKLPKASTAPGRIYTVKRTVAGSANITLQPSSGDQVEGVATNYTVSTGFARDCFTIISDGNVGWWIINKF